MTICQYLPRQKAQELKGFRLKSKLKSESDIGDILWIFDGVGGFTSLFKREIKPSVKHGLKHDTRQEQKLCTLAISLL